MARQVDILGDGIGELELLGTLGSDLAAVNGARASFGTAKEAFDEKDASLLARLGRDQHQTPLRHVYFQFRVKAPEFVARQWYKHIVGCEYAFKDLPWSEFSQRYKEVSPEFYVPNMTRGQSDTNKQASNGTIDLARGRYEDCYAACYHLYLKFLELGVAREQARIVLPLATYTEWTWTCSIQAAVHFCVLRDHEGAQWEIQQYAKALASLARPSAEHTWDTLTKNHPVSLQKQLKELQNV